MKNRTGIWLGAVTLVVGVIILKSSCIAQQMSYPIDSKVFSTVERTIVPTPVPANSPKIQPYDVTKFSQFGYGNWQYGKGLAFQQRFDLMPATYAKTSIEKTRRLLNFFVMTDIHITDKESPAQAIFYGYKWGVLSGYSPAMLYSNHVLDASIQTVNALHKKNPFDFGISLGDDCNSTQFNELRWFIDAFDGKEINPDSGEKDDPVAGPLNDYQDIYKAAGLNRSIPWYAALGNHDHFWMGCFPPNDYIKTAIIGNTMLNMGNVFKDPTGTKSRGFYMGAIDGRTINGDVIGAGAVNNVSQVKIPADLNRRSLTKQQWMNEFFTSSSKPLGHGFNKKDAAKGFACYSFKPQVNTPVKIIVLDDTQKDDTVSNHIHGHSFLDQERYNWLVKELENGQKGNELMIIAAHVPIGINDQDAEFGWDSTSVITEDSLINKLHSFPNLILWVAGHRHLNNVTSLPYNKLNRNDHPERGFWVVETSSLREYPQQFRTIEIVRNGDNTISIFAANIDPAVKEGSFAAKSRSYAIAANQIFEMKQNLLPTGSLSYNVELIKQLSPEMQQKLDKMPAKVSLPFHENAVAKRELPPL